MASPEILFVFPPSVRILHVPPTQIAQHVCVSNFTHHIGSAYIRAFLKEKRIESEQFVTEAPLRMDDIISRIGELQPKVVGFTMYQSNFLAVRYLAQELRRRFPRIKLIAGGPSPTTNDSLVFRRVPELDLCVRGEGEHAVFELLSTGKIFENSKFLFDIAGLSFVQNGQLVRTHNRAYSFSIDSDKDGLDRFPSPYLSGLIPIEKEDVGVLSSRGCPYGCTYCMFSSLSHLTVRYHSEERFMAELRMFSESLNGRPFSIHDDAFSLNLKRSKHILKRILEEKLNLNFWCETRADCVDEEFIYLLKEAGCYGINFGLESAVPRILRNVMKLGAGASRRKDLKPEEKFIQNVHHYTKVANLAGLKVQVSVIFGLPGETLQDGIATLEFVKKLPIESYYHNHLVILPGTDLARTHNEYGIGLEYTDNDPFRTMKTVHSYDLFELPMLANSTVKQKFDQFVDQVREQVFGEFYSEDDLSSSFMFYGEGPINDEMARFIDLNSKVNTAVYFFSRDENEASFSSSIDQLIEEGVGLRFSVKVLEKQTEVGTSFLLSPKSIFFNNYGNVFRNDEKFFRKKFLPAFKEPLGHKISLAKIDASSRLTGRCKTVVEASEDIDALLGWVKAFDAGVVWPIPWNFSGVTSMGVENECRWMSSPCPIEKREPLIVFGNGCVGSCVKDPACTFGSVKESRRELIQKLQKMREEAELERGCFQCPAKDVCSRCLFPQVSVDKFCETVRVVHEQKLGESLRHVFMMLKTLPSFSRELGLDDLSSVLVEGNQFSKGPQSLISTFVHPEYSKESSFIVPDYIKLLRCKGDYFVISTKNEHIYKMNQISILILEVLKKKGSQKDILSSLRLREDLFGDCSDLTLEDLKGPISILLKNGFLKTSSS